MSDIKAIKELPFQTLSFLEELRCSAEKSIFLEKDDSSHQINAFALISCKECKGFLIPIRISLDTGVIKYHPQLGIEHDYSLIQFISSCGINTCANEKHQKKETTSRINDFILLNHNKDDVCLSCKITEINKYSIENIDFLEYGDNFTSFKLRDGNILYIVKNSQTENLLARDIYIIDKDNKIIDSYKNILSKQLQILLP